MKNFRLIDGSTYWLWALVCPFLFAIPVASLTKTPTFEGRDRLQLQYRVLKYANPFSTQNIKHEIASLDDALVLVAKNIQVQRYNRDSLGLEQSQFAIEVDSSRDLLALRNQIVDWLDAIPLRYDIGEDRRGSGGSLIRFDFNFGTITRAGAYFTLRDSLMTLRSKTVRVKVEEVPYSRPQNLDSLQWFLEMLRSVELKNKARFERFFLKKFFEDRNSYALDLDLKQGLHCVLSAKLPASEMKAEEKPMVLPRWMIPFRNAPWELRMEYFQVLVLLCLALSATSLVLTLAILAAFLWKRREKSRKAKE